MAEEVIKKVSGALHVLDVLRKEDEPMSVPEIVNKCALKPSAVRRIIRTLEEVGWVSRLNENLFLPGPKAERICGRDTLHMALADAAGAILGAYVERWQEAINLMILDGAYCEIIQQAKSQDKINYVPPVGTRLPFYSCAGGKVLVSELPEIWYKNLFTYSERTPLTANTITDDGAFLQEVQNVRKSGFSTDYHEVLEVGSCVAVPVRDRAGTIIASLSYSGLLNVQNKEELADYVPDLKAASKELTNRLYPTTRDNNAVPEE